MRKILLFILLLVLIIFTMFFQKVSSADLRTAAVAGNNIFYGG